jgi:hypothetical protein
MEGDIDMDGNEITGLVLPINTSDAANKKYIDNSLNSKLPLSGGTMTGDLDMDGHTLTGIGDPNSDGDAASQGYVSGNYLNISGGRMHGTLNMNNHKIIKIATPTDANDAASKVYVDGHAKFNTFVSKTGDTMTGNLDMDNNKIIGLPHPATNNEATNKKYVDDSVGTLDAKSATARAALNTVYVLKAGDTLTGNLDMNNNKIIGLGLPTQNNESSNKKYVDDTVSATSHIVLHKIGGSMLGNVNMNNKLVTNLGTPVNDKDAVGKKWVEDRISAIPTGGGSGNSGLSASGFTMTGNINMNDNRIIDLASPISADDATNKGYVDSINTNINSKLNTFVLKAGDTMSGDINMDDNGIKNLKHPPTNPHDAVTKQWVEDEFPTKQKVLGGFKMTGPLDLGDNEIYGVALTPNVDDAATSKKYVDDSLLTALSIVGGTMHGEIGMGNQKITDLADPTDDHDAVSKSYVTGLISGLALGLSQADADAR